MSQSTQIVAMASLNSRKGPNVSRYIANLNTVGDNAPNDEFLAQDDLSLFATTDFFDFDMGDGISGMPPASDLDNTLRAARKQSSASWQDPSNQEFLNNDFAFPDLSNFNPLATGPNAAFPTANFPIQQPITSPSTATSPTVSASTPKAGEKRKLNAISDLAANPASMDENARMAAEEDKRRRNTAASARFRIKKKQREQALEKTAKEMTEKAQMLETKVQQLEMENKWLKSLITEKNDIGKGGFEELYEKFTKGQGRSTDVRNDGVGTQVAKAEDEESEEEGADEE